MKLVIPLQSMDSGIDDNQVFKPKMKRSLFGSKNIIFARKVWRIDYFKRLFGLFLVFLLEVVRPSIETSLFFIGKKICKSDCGGN